MVIKKSGKVKVYGEKGARLDDFRQKHRPPSKLRQVFGDDEEVKKAVSLGSHASLALVCRS
ncbi:hypothetical protein BD310DRAFT_922619 [Dichomitus squalens]|uniref:Uncharacterized protein n=1 Tax=Dichomitus squalens TaxID=114155 RepID=A0A4Q9Q107_9APHY|nr:hypothetical protein BD310DRAFT_922619 [Dichomitus squalens]